MLTKCSRRGDWVSGERWRSSQYGSNRQEMKLRNSLYNDAKVSYSAEELLCVVPLCFVIILNSILYYNSTAEI